MKRIYILLTAMLMILPACAKDTGTPAGKTQVAKGCVVQDSAAQDSALMDTVPITPHDIDVVILGDSNIWLGGDDCKNPKGWTCEFARIFAPRSIHSYARSGATWTNHPNTVDDTKSYTELLADNNVIYNQVLRLQEAVKQGKQPTPQLIIIAAGGNDAWFYAKRPGIFDEGKKQKGAKLPTSLIESVKYNCTLLQKAFPDAKIVLMTPHQMTKPDPDMLRRVSDTIAKAADEMQLQVIRTDIDGPTSREQELKGFLNSYDGVHTSKRGALLTARYVVEKLNP